jgi:hypothetical protein
MIECGTNVVIIQNSQSIHKQFLLKTVLFSKKVEWLFQSLNQKKILQTRQTIAQLAFLAL